MGQVLPGNSWLPRPGLGGAGAGGPAMPRDPGGAEFGAGTDDPAPIRFQRAALLRVHPVSHRPRAAVRARQGWARGAPDAPCPAARVNPADAAVRAVRRPEAENFRPI